MTLRKNRALFVLPLLAGSLAAQSPTSPAAQSPIPPAEQQVAAAVLPLPSELRAAATVMGYREPSRTELVVLRTGTNGMTCLALYVVREDFHVACYQDGLEPFMARGRALRVEGLRGPQVDSVRFRELLSGALKMPPAAALYSLTARKEDYDPATNSVKAARPLTVVYVPGATPESLGISAQPSATAPWLMFPGTPKAHIMITGTMTP